MLIQVMFHMQAFAFCVVGAYLAPWLPYIWFEKLPIGKIFDAVNVSTSTGILGEAFSSSLYKGSVVNEHSMWATFFGDRQKFLENSKIPFVFSMMWILMTNLAVILMSRTNKQLSSHKKSMLQLVLCLQANFIVGSPKMQNYEAVLTTICLLQLLLYSDYSSYGLVFSIAPAFTMLPEYPKSQLPAYFMGYAFQFYVMAPLLQSMIFNCMA